MTADVGYYDESYPPSIYPPPPPQAAGATAGVPGAWTPAGCRVPADLAQTTAWAVVASPATAWTAGQYVQTATAGAAGRVSWNGTGWVSGAVPLAAPPPDPEPSGGDGG